MGSFRPRSDDRRSGRPDTRRSSFSRGRYDGGGRFGDRDEKRNNFQKTEVTCSKCGKQCLVPFKPTGSKPVYCSSCFSEQSGTSPRGNFESRDRPASTNNQSSISPEQFNQLNAKLDKILEILETLEIIEDEEAEDEDDSEDSGEEETPEK